ncbi:MAG: response regulator [Nitrospinae bacterium]|nr:response regulator [Nitrospinota bacterium]
MTLKILCIDSEEQNLADLTKELCRLEYEILTANSRSKGWDTFVSNDIDIVLMDLYLDSELCVDLIEELQFVKPDIGVFIFTDTLELELELVIQLIDLEILGLIEKPIQWPLFLKRLDKKLKKKFLQNSHKTQYPKLAQCSLCTRVSFSDINGINKNEKKWVSLNQFLEESYKLTLKPEFCLQCSKLTFDQVEKYLAAQFKKLMQGEIPLKK